MSSQPCSQSITLRSRLVVNGDCKATRISPAIASREGGCDYALCLQKSITGLVPPCSEGPSSLSRILRHDTAAPQMACRGPRVRPVKSVAFIPRSSA